MIPKLDMPANEAVNRVINAFCKGMQAPDNRMKMEDWFAQLREPISYSNEDIDREAQFADFIYSLVTKER